MPPVICIPFSIRLLAFGSASPGGPSPCPGHYSQAFGYYAASVLPSARWQFAPHCWAKRCGSSPVPIADVVAIRSCPLYAGCAVE